jgi:uncharacterized surface protein with fasciclin (FAS1) repeats
MKKIIALFAALTVTAAASFAADDIVTIAKSTGMHNTLVKAIEAGGLVDTLKGPGPFTVFAPTDDAFKKLPPTTLTDLLKPENKEKLATVLKNHVVAGAVMSSDVKTGPVKAVGGGKLDVTVDGGKVNVEGANVVKADVKASNGVIHVVDAVILPN